MSTARHTLCVAAAALLFIAATLFLAACGAKQKTRHLTLEEAEKSLLSAETYTCDHHIQVRAAYPDLNTAVVEYDGTVHVLENAVSASGARYIDDRIEWWVKGAGKNADASLFAHKKDGKGDALAKNCRIR